MKVVQSREREYVSVGITRYLHDEALIPRVFIAGRDRSVGSINSSSYYLDYLDCDLSVTKQIRSRARRFIFF